MCFLERKSMDKELLTRTIQSLIGEDKLELFPLRQMMKKYSK